MRGSRHDRYVARVAMTYAAIGGLWILLSDRLLVFLADPELAARAATFKGLAFIAVTTVALILVLRRAPEAPREGTAHTLPSSSSRVRRYTLLLFAVLAGGLGSVVVVGVISYRAEQKAMFAGTLEELRSVAEQKADSISRWLDDLRRSSAAAAGNPLLARALARWSATHSPEDRDVLMRTLDFWRVEHSLRAMLLVEGTGTVLVASGEPLAIEEVDRGAIAEAIERYDTMLVDWRRDAGADANAAELALASPVRAANGSLLAVALLSLDPRDQVVPLLEGRPLRDARIDVALVRAIDTRREVIARSRSPGPARALSHAASDDFPLPDQLSVGQTAAFEAVDSSGTPVLFGTAPVRGTAWQVVAAIDRGAALAPSRRLGDATAAIVLAALAACAGLMMLIRGHALRTVGEAELAQSRALGLAQAALRESEERFRLAMLATDEGLWDHDLRTNKMYYSPRYLSMLGYEPGEVGNGFEGFTSLIHPDDAAPAVAAIGSLLTSDEDRAVVEMRLRHKSGRYVRVLVRALVVRDAQGRPIRAIGTHLDVTERRRLEERDRTAAVILANSQEGIVLTDPVGAIAMVNPAFTTITGYTEAELIGRNMSLLHSGRQDRNFYDALWQALTTIGSWQGEIWNRRKSGEIFPEWLTISALRDSAGKIVNYIGMFSDITRAKESESLIEFFAHHDPLTHLPNRLLFQSRLEGALARARRTGKRGAVLYLDLDRFKDINDSLGHPAGDEILVMVAERLCSRLRETDTIARQGGDEFVILLEDVGDEIEVASVAQALIDRLRAPFRLSGGQEIFIGASVGISMLPDHGLASGELLRNADAALYRAKATERGTFQFYSSALTEAATARLAMMAELSRAVERDELVIHYQPIVRLADRRLIGVEALVRWQHPTKGLLPPSEFISLAEEMGLIGDLGRRVLRTACGQARAWLDRGVPLETMAVNLSSRQFRAADLVPSVAAILAETKLPAATLELEITETSLMDSEGEDKLAALQALGLRLAIDDFGTGYSSFAYLRRFPVTKLKIDRSFVQEIPGDRAAGEIAGAIVAVGKVLGFEVLAEGVETDAQCTRLRELGCDTGQGFLFSAPVTAETAEAMLRGGEDSLRRSG